MKITNPVKVITLSIVWIWLLLFAFIPFCLVLMSSFLSHSEHALLQLPVTLNNYLALNNALYIRIFEKSFMIAGVTTLLCLIIGYPVAYIIARLQGKGKNLLLLLIIIPFWTSSLIRSYALIALLKTKGLINGLLLSLGIIEQPLNLLFTNTAVIWRNFITTPLCHVLTPTHKYQSNQSITHLKSH